MKAQPPQRLTKQHMVAVAVALKVYEGGSARDLAALRQSMNTAHNARAVFDALVHSRGDCGFPWQEMGAPEEDTGADDLGSESCSGMAAEGEEEDAVVEGAAAEDEDAADEEDEDLALGILLESVVTAVGSEAEKLVDEIDDAASDTDARAIAEGRIESNLGQRARRISGRYL